MSATPMVCSENAATIAFFEHTLGDRYTAAEMAGCATGVLRGLAALGQAEEQESRVGPELGVGLGVLLSQFRRRTGWPSALRLARPRVCQLFTF